MTADDNGEIARLRRRVLRERTARMEAESIAERFTRGALHDPLTGLANRVQLLDRMNVALARSDLLGGSVGVLFLDLDRFKRVNDSLGHGYGDDLLREVADRLVQACRRSDVVCRLGGDEFVVLCEGVVDADELRDLGDRIAVMLAAPLDLAGNPLTVLTSIGMRLASAVDTADGVLRDADAAMYAAKRLGSGHRVLFDGTTRLGALDRLGIESELRTALLRGDIVPVYQRVVDLHSGRTAGAECLARWEHPSRGQVTPAEFIAVAEDCGLIAELDRHMIGLAVQQAAAWGFGSYRPGVVSANLSAATLDDERLVADVAASLASNDLPGSALCLEITECAPVHEGAWTKRNAVGLRELGVLLAIDDFGEGPATFGHLRRFPADGLKINGSVVANLVTKPRERAFIAGTVAMARTLGLTTTAGHIETSMQADILRDLGVDRGQGWFFGRPVSAEQMDVAVSTVA